MRVGIALAALVAVAVFCAQRVGLFDDLDIGPLATTVSPIVEPYPEPDPPELDPAVPLPPLEPVVIVKTTTDADAAARIDVLERDLDAAYAQINALKAGLAATNDTLAKATARPARKRTPTDPAAATYFKLSN